MSGLDLSRQQDLGHWLCAAFCYRRRKEPHNALPSNNVECTIAGT